MSGDSSSSTFHDFQEFIILISKNQEFWISKIQKWTPKFPEIRQFSNIKINTLESLLILFSINSYYFRLIHGLIASFLAFCSALGSWLMAGSSLVARRSAPVPFPGPGPALLLQGAQGSNSGAQGSHSGEFGHFLFSWFWNIILQYFCCFNYSQMAN